MRTRTDFGRNTIAIEINAECVNQFSKTPGVADGNVDPANRRISAHRWKRVCNYVVCAVIVEAHGNIILGTAASQPTLVPPKAWFTRMLRSSLFVSAEVM